MKKNAVIFFINGCLLLLVCFTGYSQNPTISSSFPKIAPPSPTVAGLMKFEEIPVNNYTGIPDISIPLFSVQTRSQDIALNLSLNYHPASIAANEIAGYVGLGWSLLAGGSISRTVRGLPDDFIKGTDPKKYGIYHNNFEQVNLIRDGVGNIDAPHNDIAEKYLWEAVEKGMLDTEYDIYQYNFMGNTGRFFMKKKSPLHYEIIPLTNTNAIKISFDGTIFTLTDDKGYQYIFDVPEVTQIITTTSVKPFEGTFGVLDPNSNSESTYVSAYHLSRIEDNTSSADANQLVTFNYFSTPFYEIANDITETTSVITSPSKDALIAIFNNQCDNSMFGKLEPESVTNLQIRTTETKKLQSIFVPNKAKIYFTLDNNREDRTFKNSIVAPYRLHKIIIKDWEENQIKKYELFHYYSEIKSLNVRMLLNSVVENDTHSYNLSYAGSPAQHPSSTDIGIDYWGFFNLRPSNRSGGIYRETSSTMCITNVLTGMTLPTGGIINYEFQPNEYSYNGAIRLEDFSENPDRFREAGTIAELTDRRKLSLSSCPEFTYDPLKCPFLKIEDRQAVTFIAQRDPAYTTENWRMMLCNSSYASYIDSPSTPTTAENWLIGDGHDCPGLRCPIEVTLNPGWYYVYWEGFDTGMNPPLHYFVGAKYLERNPDTYYKKYLIGGGVRIKSITYTGGNKLLGKKSYNYDFFDEDKRSSGSLAFPKPLYEYTKTVRHNIRKTDCDLIEANFARQSITYKSTTSFDNLKPINTQGAYVGYKNVSVSQTGYIPGSTPEAAEIEIKNGKIEYTYTSPIDVPIEYSIDYSSTPNPTYSIPYPFNPPVNKDYKRGILKNEKYYDENNKLLSEVLYDHDIVEGSIITGIRPYSTNECPFAKLFIDYVNYMSNYLNCQETNNDIICYNCGDPSAYLTSVDSKETFGWVKLKEKISKNYFYDKNNIQNTVQVKETFQYHDLNKKITEYTKETYNKINTEPEKIKEQYIYLYNSTVAAQNDISKIWIVNNTFNEKTISRQMINYSPSLSHGNPDYLPQTIAVAKGEFSYETKLKFNLYDKFGSPVEIQKENGMSVVYIYDYNHRNPIAMIENATYTEVESLLGSPANGIAYSEADNIALNNLRDQLNNSNVTTYTYIPLVGISSIIDPRGQKTTYYYDTFGRLIQVKDHNDNILSENVYKYWNQN